MPTEVKEGFVENGRYYKTLDDYYSEQADQIISNNIFITRGNGWSIINLRPMNLEVKKAFAKEVQRCAMLDTGE